MSALLAVFLAACPAAFAAPSAVDAALAKLTVEEKVGQLFTIAIDTDIAARYEPMIRAGKLGGAILRWDKFTGAEAKALAATLRGWTDSSPGKVPVLLAADHEGGPVFTQRRYGGTIFPGNMALGAARSEKLAYEAALATGRELRSWSIGVDYAPSVDVNNDPENPIIGLRSFGEDPKLVARLGAAAIRGYLKGGVLPAAKHFPGHGDTKVDSHKDLPMVAKPLKEWRDIELPPFAAAVAAGAPMIMTAHIVPAAIDPLLSATLSTAALQGELRGKLGYRGVIVSDSLDMAAIAKTYGTPEAALMAFQAGCDMLLIGKGDYPGAYERLLKAAKEGTFPAKRLNASVRRNLALKRRLDAAAQAPDFAANQALADRIAREAATLLKNEGGLLPLKPAGGETLAVVVARTARFDEDIKLLEAEIKRRHAKTEFVAVGPRPSPKTIEEVAARISSASVVVFGSFEFFQIEPGTFEKQMALYARLKESGKPVVVASLMNPYDLGHYADAPAMTASYGITPAAMRALAMLLFGELEPRGRLPVSVPGLFKRGQGLGRQAKSGSVLP
jgi:beta-N-acetylhexosaminidase